MTTQKNAVNSGNAKSSARKGLSFTKEELIDLHWIQGLSMTEIGRRHDVSASAMKYWMSKFSLEHRSQVKEILFEPSPALSYVLGVLHGDAFVYSLPRRRRYVVILAVVDKEFAFSFKRALETLGMNANTIAIPPSREGNQPQWKTYAHSKKFMERWNALSPRERIKWGMKYPRDFLRGVYESKGSVKFHRGSLELSIYSTNVMLQKVIMGALTDLGLTPKWYSRPLESGKTMVYIQLFRSLEIKRFMTKIIPCIKYRPRNFDGRQANREPSRDGDVPEGVETTKATRSVVE